MLSSPYDKSSVLDFTALLDLLGFTDDEFLAICHESEADGIVFNSRVTDKASAAEVVAALPEGNVWFSVNPTQGPARVKDGRGGGC